MRAMSRATSVHRARLERAYPAEICTDSFQADRSPDRIYRTAPLAGLFSHQKGGFYHDGRFATLPDVVNHYDQCMNLGLSGDEKTDLVQYLLTLAEVLLVSVPAQIHKAYRQRPRQDTDVHLIRKSSGRYLLGSPNRSARGFGHRRDSMRSGYRRDRR